MSKLLIATVAALILTGIVFTIEAQAQSVQQLELPISNSSQSSNNTAQFTLFDTLNKDSLSVFLKANGGVFANEVLTIKGALSQTGNYTTIETEASGTGTTKGFHYSGSFVNTTAAGQSANPTDFRFLNFSLPALGVNQTSVIQITAK